MNVASKGMFAGSGALLNRDVAFRVRLAWRLWRDERVTGLKYGLPVLLALYFISPVDVIPDWFLGIGHSDDVGVAIAAVLLLARIMPRLAPASVVDEHVRAMDGNRWTPAPHAAATNGVVDAQFSVRS